MADPIDALLHIKGGVLVAALAVLALGLWVIVLWRSR